MADAFDAWHKDHAGGEAGGENLRVVSRAAVHHAEIHLLLFAQGSELGDQSFIHGNRGFIHPQVDFNANIHFLADPPHIAFDHFSKCR